MAQTRISVWFRSEDYEAIRRLIPNETELPPTFEEWREAAQEQIAELSAAGIGVRKAFINPYEFSRWCQASGVDHNMETLRSFAVVVDRKNMERGA